MSISIESILASTRRFPFNQLELELVVGAIKSNRGRGGDLELVKLGDSTIEEMAMEGVIVFSSPEILASEFIFTKNDGGKGMLGRQLHVYGSYVGLLMLDDFMPGATFSSWLAAVTSVNTLYLTEGKLQGSCPVRAFEDVTVSAEKDPRSELLADTGPINEIRIQTKRSSFERHECFALDEKIRRVRKEGLDIDYSEQFVKNQESMIADGMIFMSSKDQLRMDFIIIKIEAGSNLFGRKKFEYLVYIGYESDDVFTKRDSQKSLDGAFCLVKEMFVLADDS